MPVSPSFLRSIMAAHFAGSASVSDRRRRRLAQESDRTRIVSTSGSSTRTSRNTPSGESSAEVDSSTVVPRRRTIVPRDGRILGLYCALNVLSWGIMLWLGLSSWAEQRGLEQLTTLKDGPVLRYFSTIQLLAASQLCFLIYWHRSRSRKDFMGRYRIWSWAGLFWGGVCFSLAAHLDYHFMHVLLERFSLDAWRPETICWLLPLSVGVISLYRVLRREMRYSQASLISWEISFGMGVLSALMALGFENVLPETVRHSVNVSLWSLWLVTVSTTYLIHLRYVVHVSNEAAPRFPSRGTRLMRWSQRGMTKVGERVLASRPRYRRKLKELPEAPKEKASSRRAPQAKKSESLEAEATVRKKAVPAKSKFAETGDEPDSTEETSKTRTGWNWLRFGRKKEGRTVRLDPPVKAESVVPAPHVAPAVKSAVKSATPEKSRARPENVKKEPVSTEETPKVRTSWNWLSFRRKRDSESKPVAPAPSVAPPVKPAVSETPRAASETVKKSEKIKKESDSAEETPKTRTSWNWLPFGRKKDGESKPVATAPSVAPPVKSAVAEQPRVQEKRVEKPAPVAKAATTPPTSVMPKPVAKASSPARVEPVKAERAPVVESKPVPPPPPTKAPVKPVAKSEYDNDPEEDDRPSRPVPKSSSKPSYDYDMEGESDLDLDEDDFSGLSSKERKKLKKLRKQQARAQK